MDAPIRYTAPTVEPVTLAEVKTHLRINHSEEDSYLAMLITVAPTAAEDRTGRTMLETTWQYTLDGFPDEIVLPNPPIISVTHVKYKDSDNVLQTLSASDYVVDTASQPGRIVRAYGKDWPATYDEINTVVVTYKAGYGTSAASVPAPLKQWILLAIGDMYDQSRSLSSEKVLTPSKFVDSLIDPYRFIGL